MSNRNEPIGMRSRTLAVAALAVALVLLACGVALAVAPASGGWKGRTGQNKAVSFKVNPQRRGVCSTTTCIGEFEFSVKARCRVSLGRFRRWSSFSVKHIFGRLNVSGQGRFSFKNTDSTGGKVSGSGAFTSERTAKGTIHYAPKYFGRTVCNKRITWHASLVTPGAVS